MRLLKVIMSAMTLTIPFQSAQAACLNPFGCVASNYDECVTDATKRPTEVGVKLARQQCYDKWKLPEIEKAASMKAAAAEKRASTWAAMDNVTYNAEAWISKLGQPDLVLGPAACSPVKDAKLTKAQTCYTYFWNDERLGRVSSAYFKAEVLNESRKPLWAYWPDSFSR